MILRCVIISQTKFVKVCNNVLETQHFLKLYSDIFSLIIICSSRKYPYPHPTEVFCSMDPLPSENSHLSSCL